MISLFNKHAIERVFTIKCTGSNLKVTGDNYPDIHGILRECCDILNYPGVPDLYIEWGYGINGYTIGVDHPIIVLQSGCIDLLTEKELRCVIGHELGHIKSRHTLYHQMAQALPLLAEYAGNVTLGLGNLASMPLRFALLKWSRLSELTADRAGLLAAQDQTACMQLMSKMAGVPLKHYGAISCEGFIQQARDFDKLSEDKLNMIVKWAQIAGEDHPWTVMRAAELLRWIESGEYAGVLAGTNPAVGRRISSGGGPSAAGTAQQGQRVTDPGHDPVTILECPNCSQMLRVPALGSRQRIRCTACRQVFSQTK